MKRRDLMISAAAAAVAGVPRLASAQGEFPRSGASIRYVVPFPPGGLTDMMARMVGQKLSDTWKVPVVVDNRAGANGQLGADIVAKAPPDGNTLLAITLTHAANVALFPQASYSLLRDLRALALMASSPMLVVVPAASPVKDFKDLVAVSKSRRLNAGSSGNGTPPHLTMALFNDLNKSQMTHVPYKGGSPSIVDLIGGQLDVIFSNFPESIAHVQGGKLRALAICSPARHAMLPDVPTTTESGMPDLLVENWTGATLPARTPDAIVDTYSREVVRIMSSRDIEEKASQQGFRVGPKGADEFARYLESEVDRWGRIIRTARITAG